MDYAAETGVGLIIVLDCGIKAVEEITYAKEKGIDFIICDHHVPDDILPPAVAILNAKRPDNTYPTHTFRAAVSVSSSCRHLLSATVSSFIT